MRPEDLPGVRPFLPPRYRPGACRRGDQILQSGIPALVQLGTQIPQPLRPLNACRQDVGCKCVDSEDMRQTIFSSDSPGLSIPDTGVVNHGVEGTELVHLIGNATRLGNACQIADDHCLRTRHACHYLPSPLFRASMQDYSVSLLNE